MALGFRAGGAQHTITKQKTDPNAINAAPLTNALFNYADLKDRKERRAERSLSLDRMGSYHQSEFRKLLDDPDSDAGRMELEEFGAEPLAVQRAILRDGAQGLENRQFAQDIALDAQFLQNLGPLGVGDLEEIMSPFSGRMEEPGFNREEPRDKLRERADKRRGEVTRTKHALKWIEFNSPAIDMPGADMYAGELRDRMLERLEGYGQNPAVGGITQKELLEFIGEAGSGFNGKDARLANEDRIREEAAEDAAEYQASRMGPGAEEDAYFRHTDRRGSREFASEGDPWGRVDSSQQPEEGAPATSGQFGVDDAKVQDLFGDAPAEGAAPEKDVAAGLVEAIPKIKAMASVDGRVDAKKMDALMAEEASRLLGRPVTAQEVRILLKKYKAPK